LEEPPSTTRVALYARVSTEEQREGQTIDSQIAELEKFAKQKSWVVLDVYKDEGWSGSVLARPELDRLRDDAKNKLFHAVLANDVDRLARDVTHLGVVRRDLERHGVRLLFPKLPLEANANSNFMMNIFGSFAEFERELIADRTRRGRRYKAEVRKKYIGCLPPYGYRYTTISRSGTPDGTLEIEPEHAAVIQKMFTWVDEEGLSCLAVMRRLTQLGIPTPKGFGRWRSSTVHRILRRETYAGLWHYGKCESVEPLDPVKPDTYRKSLKSARRFRPRDEWIPVHLPEELHIVDRSRWERAQRQLDRNRPFSSRHSKHNYLLHGLTRCGSCKTRYIGEKRSGEARYTQYYYRCGAGCKAYPWIREERLNDVIWNSLKNALANPAMVEQYVRKLRGLRKPKLSTQKEGTAKRDAALQQYESKELRAIESYRAGSLTSSELANTLDEINREKKALDSSQNQLWNSATTAAAAKRTLDDYCRKVLQSMEDASFENRQRLLRLLISEIIFEGVQVRIRGALNVDQYSASASVHQLDSSGPSAIVGIMPPTSRSMERNPHKMEFEIVAPLATGYFKKAGPIHGHSNLANVPWPSGIPPGLEQRRIGNTR
jgi:site-specific DNA recombinase